MALNMIEVIVKNSGHRYSFGKIQNACYWISCVSSMKELLKNVIFNTFFLGSVRELMKTFFVFA